MARSSSSSKFFFEAAAYDSHDDDDASQLVVGVRLTQKAHPCSAAARALEDVDAGGGGEGAAEVERGVELAGVERAAKHELAATDERRPGEKSVRWTSRS